MSDPREAEEREDLERQERLAEEVLTEADATLRTFREGYGHLQRYAAVNHAIDLLFAVDHERNERQTAEATS